MWFPMREVGMEFLDTADKVWVMEAHVAAGRPAVWKAISDPTVWPEWFPGVEKAWYEGDPPYGVGTVRRARVSGQDMDEVMVCWEHENRWAYYLRGASYPLARAQLECTELIQTDGGTLMRWTIASDRGWLLWLATPVFHRTVTRLWNRVARNLEAWLHQGDAAR
ncbi:MAG: SRPBCC family protein [Deltaproteobacteria bacterium]|nr:SRPBCC family protein [Deltaproteobacteria bacterium]